MENFIVSARKYRPATFDMVVGQSSITNTLKSAIKINHLAQAYLFCGPRGVGKTTCARIFAKTINCSNLKENGEACDECESCLSFNTLRSFNIHELDAASNNKVDDIRSLTDQVRIPPQVGKYSIYIIDEVHMLSSSAFNAFLKTLEEPPSHAIFILATTEKHKIIPTILSRCQIFDFNRIRIEDIVARLRYVADNELVTIEEEALHVIAQKADGALRDALSIFDQIVSFSGKSVSYQDVIENLNVLDYEYYFRTVDAALESNVSKILLIFNDVLEKGFDGHNFISGLNSHLRNLLVSKDNETIKLLEATPSIKQRYTQQAEKSPVDFLFNALEIGNTCDLEYKGSKNQRLLVELSLFRLCRINLKDSAEAEKKKPDTDTLNEPVVPVPSRSKLFKKEEEKPFGSKPASNSGNIGDSGDIQKNRSFSVKNLISAENGITVEDTVADQSDAMASGKHEFAEITDENFRKAWSDFSEEVKNDGPRVVSMFKSISTELHPDGTISLHLSNAAQRDSFNQHYKQRLALFLQNRFGTAGMEIESVVDTSETDGVIYSDEQKYNHLSSKYPVLKEMRKAFNLDFE